MIPIMHNYTNNFINTNNMPININIPTATFPTIFFDGEREIDLGNVDITPLMSYKSFSRLISDIIGISPHQITIYLEHRHNPNQNYHLTPPSHHRRNRQPVTSKFDFPSLVAARSSGAASECYFSAVLKRRTRRARHHRATRNHHSDVSNKVVLLRRESGMNVEEMMYMNRYLMSLDMNSNVYDELYNNYDDGNYANFDGFNDMSGGSDDVDNMSSTTGSDRVYCDVCYNFSAADTVPFHWCKNDVVTNGFKSGAGPIAPPSKN